MKTTLLHPMYFGSIAQYVAIAQSDSVIFENEDNYQKQTYRNRTYIYGANGKLLLSIPIKHSKKGIKQLYRDVQIENEFPWQQLHWKSLQTAYRTSPFFEYYEDEFVHLFRKKRTFLLDFNYECMQILHDCMQIDMTVNKTNEYIRTPENMTDLRSLVDAKKEIEHDLEPYIQVFEDKYGFLPNISILDLLFNEGTNALTYLENQKIFNAL
ncbi:WbqC family protein [Aquimarina pacifica]|uniref:WbqC family protein n=1 Tax=Aquimarina pacifica TaxID=1296415 RepID=UPI000472D357|nr:WbqC family protein [Aquimarina pacifica]